jgi:RNA polymerase sigma factor (sigma-70 family)
MDPNVEALVERATNGDPLALDAIVRQIQDRIYGLAIRMLWHPQDAEDATQEILVKIVTHLGSFRNESSFATWCYRIATNHLLTCRKRRAELMELSFASLEDEIDRGLEYSQVPSSANAEQDLLAKEVMIGCIQGVMQCLDRPHRIAYVLGEVYEVDSRKGSEILGISPEAFRKRLSRSRTLIRDFLERNCGAISPSNRCNCSRQVPYALKTGLVNSRRLLFAEHPTKPEPPSVNSPASKETDDFRRVSAILRGPEYAVPNRFMERVRTWIRSEGAACCTTRH